VTHRYHSIESEGVFDGQLRQVVGCGSNIRKGPGPASIRVTDSAILDAPGGDTILGQRGRHTRDVPEIIFS
jgi:hypothetical protein